MAIGDMSMKHDADPASARAPMISSLLKRVATSLVFIPAFVWLVMRARGWLFAALVCAAATVALWELLRLFENAAVPTYRRLGLVLGVAIVASFEVAGGSSLIVPTLPVLVLCLAVIAVLSAPVVLGQRPAAEPVAFTVLGLVYVSWLFGHALLLHRLPAGDELVLLLVGVTWVGETGAYAIGSMLGRHRLAPEISPKKTVEGSVAQFVASIVAAIALAAWLVPAWSVLAAAAAGALLGVVGQLGDLAESAIKRSAGVKDAGGLIPGHGGVLDRIDGLLFNVPALYYYVRLGVGS